MGHEGCEGRADMNPRPNATAPGTQKGSKNPKASKTSILNSSILEDEDEEGLLMGHDACQGCAKRSRRAPATAPTSAAVGSPWGTTCVRRMPT